MERKGKGREKERQGKDYNITATIDALFSNLLLSIVVFI